VPSCCVDQGDYRRFFRRSVARRDAKRFRRKGLDAAGRRLVEAIAARGVAGAHVLEAGGGVGGIQIALLEAGAEGATAVELSTAYDEEAETLLRERGLAGRVERRVGDFVSLADSLPRADVVVLHRAVCCYPDGRAFVAAAAGRSTRLLALSFPRERALTRAGVRAVNLFLRLRGCGFRTFVHPADDLLAAAREQGLRPVAVGDATPVWRLALLERA
jgi:magnesium-protoporphyrin O-methyltransferase